MCAKRAHDFCTLNAPAIPCLGTPPIGLWHTAPIPKCISVVLLERSTAQQIILNEDERHHRSEHTSIARSEAFALGRQAARFALKKLNPNWERISIPKQCNRAPRWPDGVSGSISHSAGLALAAVSLKKSMVGIGIDVESIRTPSPSLLTRILTPAEQLTWNNGDGSWRDLLFTAFFSAKESLFKLTHPLTMRFLGFQQAKITLHHSQTADFSVYSPTLDPSTLLEGPLTWQIIDPTWHADVALQLIRPVDLSSGQGWWQAVGGYVSTLLWKEA